MNKIIWTITFSALSLNTFAQRIRTIETDTAIFYVDTQTFTSSWGGASYTGQQHVGTNTRAYSQTNGYENTKKIVAALGAGSYPAYRCDTLVLNSKNDWYLPSGNESKMVYKALNSSRVFPQGWYWTSSDQDIRPYDNFWTYDAWAWRKWFGGGEGDIYELLLKIDEYPSFCIYKERKITTGFTIDSVTPEKSTNYKLYNITGIETTKIPNKVLIKKYDDGKIEKIIYTE